MASGETWTMFLKIRVALKMRTNFSTRRPPTKPVPDSEKGGPMLATSIGKYDQKYARAMVLRSSMMMMRSLCGSSSIIIVWKETMTSKRNAASEIKDTGCSEPICSNANSYGTSS